MVYGCACLKTLLKVYFFLKKEVINLFDMACPEDQTKHLDTLKSLDAIDTIMICILMFWIYCKCSDVYDYFYYKGFLNGITEAVWGRIIRFPFMRRKVDEFLAANFIGRTHDINELVDPP